MNIACIGTSEIVEHFIDACKKIDGINVFAVYTRTYVNGLNIANKYEINNIYENLEKMLKCKEIDTVYIASPNSLHFEQAVLCIKSKKNVIVEKPFCTNSNESEILIKLSKIEGVFIFEAMSLLFLPNLDLLKQNIKKIGTIRWIETSCIQYSRKYNSLLIGELPNVFNPVYSGGALMDLNIYNIYFVYELLGKPVSFNYDYQKHANGIDLSGQFVMKYNYALATCFSAKNCHGKPFAYIHGEEGCIEISSGVNGLKNFSVTIKNNIENYNIQNSNNHFIYEMMEFKRIISENDVGKAELLNAKTQYIMELLTEARYKAGLFFKNDIDVKFQE